MAMQVGAADDGEEALNSAINTTPLVDVMLVLLIIFLITIPVVTTSVPVELPRERLQPRESRPEHVVISVDARGAVHWHDTPVDAAALAERLRQAAARTPQPEVHIRGDRAARYEPVGRVVRACQRAGLTRVSFLTEPPPLR